MQGHICSHHTSRTISRTRPDPLARVYVASIWSSDQGQSRCFRHSGQYGVYFVNLPCVIPIKLVYFYINRGNGRTSDVDRQHHFLCPASQLDASWPHFSQMLTHFYQLQDGWDGLLAT